MSESDSDSSLSRRQFIKASGLAGAVAGGAGLGAFGYAAGKDPNTYLGLQNEQGASLIFNRKRYEVDQPTYEKVGPSSRPDARVENIFERRGRFMRQFREVTAGGQFEEPLKSYYEEHPEDLKLIAAGVNMLVKAVAAQYRLSPKAKGDLAESITAVLNSVGDQLLPPA